MKRVLIACCCSLMLFAFGCAQVQSADDELGERGSALESEDGASCEDRCQQEFHECRESGGGGGPGASGCAHDRNDCKAEC